MTTTQPASEIRLLECPFCGGCAEVIEVNGITDVVGYYVVCTDCDGQMGDSQDAWRYQQLATEGWNRRAPNRTIEAQQARIVELEQEIQALREQIVADGWAISDLERALEGDNEDE